MTYGAGTIGAQGLQGPQGTQGTQGQQGTQGYQGSQGIFNAGSIGLTGSLVATQQSTTSTSYVDLATAGPSVTATIGSSGKAIVFIGANAWNSAGSGNSGYISFSVTGSTTLAASDTRGAMSVSEFITNGTINMKSQMYLTGLTQGSNTFTMKYRCDGGTWVFTQRSIVIIPV